MTPVIVTGTVDSEHHVESDELSQITYSSGFPVELNTRRPRIGY